MKLIIDRNVLSLRLLDAALALKLDNPSRPLKMIFKELIDGAEESFVTD